MKDKHTEHAAALVYCALGGLNEAAVRPGAIGGDTRKLGEFVVELSDDEGRSMGTVRVRIPEGCTLQVSPHAVKNANISFKEDA